MHVVDALTRVRARVEDQPELPAHLVLGDLRTHPHQCDQGVGVGHGQRRDVRVVLTRHDEHVHRRLRRHVAKGHHPLVLADDVRGHLTRDDPAEQAVAVAARFGAHDPQANHGRARRTQRGGTLAGMWIGWIEVDLLLGDVHSLKDKRSVVRPLVAELRRRFEVAAAEVDALDLHRRASIGATLVAADRAHVVEVLDAVENLVAQRPEVELLAAHRSVTASTDE